MAAIYDQFRSNSIDARCLVWTKLVQVFFEHVCGKFRFVPRLVYALTSRSLFTIHTHPGVRLRVLQPLLQPELFGLEVLEGFIVHSSFFLADIEPQLDIELECQM